MTCFNPRPSCEGRPAYAWRRPDASPFQSTPLMRGATERGVVARAVVQFQSTPLMRGATTSRQPPRCRRPVSIHAPHARGDPRTGPARSRRPGFNPRPSCEGRPPRATPSPAGSRFNPRPSCEGRPRSSTGRQPPWRFNPRPSCEGRPDRIDEEMVELPFQSTPLMRGATRHIRREAARRLVSIHAPHARGDRCGSLRLTGRRCFNPRPSCEGRPRRTRPRRAPCCFNPRPSCEGRQRCDVLPPAGVDVAIHAPHARGDLALFPCSAIQ